MDVVEKEVEWWLVMLEFLLASQLKMSMESMHRPLARPLFWRQMDVMMSTGRSRVAGGAWEGRMMKRAGGKHCLWVQMLS